MAALALAALGHKLALALRLRLGRAALGCALRLAALALSCARAALDAGQWLALGPSYAVLISGQCIFIRARMNAGPHECAC